MKTIPEYIKERLIINKDFKDPNYIGKGDNPIVNYLLKKEDDIVSTMQNGGWCFKFEPGDEVFNDILNILNENIFIDKNKIDEYEKQLKKSAICTYNNNSGDVINFVIQSNDRRGDCFRIEIRLIEQHKSWPYAKFTLRSISNRALYCFENSSSIYKMDPAFFLEVADFIVRNNKNGYKNGTPFGWDYEKRDIMQKFKML